MGAEYNSNLVIYIYNL